MQPIRLGEFEVTDITTSYLDWLSYFDDEHEGSDKIFDKECEDFAENQDIYMLAPHAILGNAKFVARRILVKPGKLSMFTHSGPLYSIYKVMMDDESADKTEERIYFDRSNFTKNYGLWYPQKEQTILQIGVQYE